MRDPGWVFFGRIPWSGVWLNRHYVARELSRDDPVLWVLDPRPWNPVRRLRAGRSRWGGIGSARPPSGIEVVRLPEAPLQRFGPFRRLSRSWSRRRLRRALRGAAPKGVVFFPRAPLSAVGEFRDSPRIFYCSDDYRYRPDDSVDEGYVRWEKAALRTADLVIAVSEPMREDLSERHPVVRLVENGVDADRYRDASRPPPPEVEALRRPRIGYVGSLRAPLLDLRLAAAAARERPEWSFCFAGWQDEGDPDLMALLALPNVLALGPRPREDLPGIMRAMDVLTCPRPRCHFATRASPLKGFEAAAAGRPLVATHSPHLDAHRPWMRNASSLPEYLAAIEEAMGEAMPGDDDPAERFSWAGRTRDFLGHVAEAAGFPKIDES